MTRIMLAHAKDRWTMATRTLASLFNSTTSYASRPAFRYSRANLAEVFGNPISQGTALEKVEPHAGQSGSAAGRPDGTASKEAIGGMRSARDHLPPRLRRLAMIWLALVLASSSSSSPWVGGPWDEAHAYGFGSRSGVTKPKRSGKDRAVVDARECMGSPGQWGAGGLGGGSADAGSARRLAAVGAPGSNGTTDAVGWVRRGLLARIRGAGGTRRGNAHSLDPYCKKERAVKKVGPKTKGERLLVACLKSAKRCAAMDADAMDQIHRTLASMRGVRKMLRPPSCMLANKFKCRRVSGNVETGREPVGPREHAMIRTAGGGKARRFTLLRKFDLPFRHYNSCAIVGNGPSLAKREYGQHIDAFDAVIRLNHIGYKNPERKRGRHLGHRTTFRVFGKQPAYEIATGSVKIVPTRGEVSWIFWHDAVRW